MTADPLPKWAANNPNLSILVKYGLTLEEAFEKEERAAIVAAEAVGPLRGPRVVYGEWEYSEALRSWDPVFEMMPIQGYRA